jgi:hypothetical protein
MTGNNTTSVLLGKSNFLIGGRKFSTQYQHSLASTAAGTKPRPTENSATASVFDLIQSRKSHKRIATINASAGSGMTSKASNPPFYSLKNQLLT